MVDDLAENSLNSSDKLSANNSYNSAALSLLAQRFFQLRTKSKIVSSLDFESTNTKLAGFWAEEDLVPLILINIDNNKVEKVPFDLIRVVWNN